MKKTGEMGPVEFSEKDLSDLQAAKYLLENPGFVVKITNYVGKPLELGLKALPDNWSEKIGELTKVSLTKATEGALLTMKDVPGSSASNIWHTIGATASGAAGGFFGFPALAVELPLTTTIMLRSILDIARSEGESISDPDVKMACLEVFAQGSNQTSSDDAADSGYFTVRAALANAMRHAAAELAAKGAAAVNKDSASLLLKYIAIIASKFGVEVSEKAALMAVPLIGSVTGAAINAVFMDHYQDIAKGHFTMRRLIRVHGEEAVKARYERLPRTPRRANPEVAGASAPGDMSVVA